MAANRDLSRFARVVIVDESSPGGIEYVGVAATTDYQNFGVGTTTPSSQLTVDGDTLFSAGVTTSSNNFVGNLAGNVTGDLVGNVTGILTGSVDGDVFGNIVGIASTAYTLTPSRTFTLSGPPIDVSIETFDGTSNVGFAITFLDTGVASGSYGSATLIPQFTVNSKGQLTAASTNPVSTGMTVAADTGANQDIIFTQDTLTIVGGDNLTSIATSETNTITVNLDDTISLSDVDATGIITALNLVATDGISTITIDGNNVSSSSSITFNTNALYVTGNLDIEGTLTSINSNILAFTDKNITVASGSADDAAADGSGFTIESTGGGNKTFNWVRFTGVFPDFVSSLSFTSSENFNLASGKTYSINGTEVLSSTTLGAGVTISSLQSVGELGYLNVKGTVTSGSFVGDINGNVSTATSLATGRNFSISGDGNTLTIFDGGSNQDIPLTLSNTGVTTGTYGSALNIPVVTVNTKGLLTTATETLVGASLTVAGDTGSETINLSTEKLTVSGGTDFATTTSTDTISIALGSDISLSDINSTGVNTASTFSGNVLTGNIYAGSGFSTTGISTYNELKVGARIKDVNQSFGLKGQVIRKVVDDAVVGTGISWRGFTAVDTTVRYSDEQTATSGQTVFNFDYYVGYLDVYVNGVLYDGTEYTATDGSTITFSPGLVLNDVVQFYSYYPTAIGNRFVKSFDDLTDVDIIYEDTNFGSILAHRTGVSAPVTGDFWQSEPDIQFIDNDLRFGLGDSTSVDRGGRLNIETTTGFSDSRIQLISNFNGSGNEASIIFGKTRGTTLGSNTVVNNGDILGNVFFSGGDGSNLTIGSGFGAKAEGSISAGSMPGRLHFLTNGTSEKAVISPGGEYRTGDGIGTDPWSGSSGIPGAYFGGANSATSFGSGFTNGNNINIIVHRTVSTNGATYIEFKFGGVTSAGAIRQGSINPNNVNYDTGSDYRLKENITNMTGAVERFKNLRPCSFNFKGYDDTQDGFIAHELQEVIPNAVVGEKDAINENGDPKYQNIDLRRTIPLFTGALKETLERLENLDARLTALS